MLLFSSGSRCIENYARWPLTGCLALSITRWASSLLRLQTSKPLLDLDIFFSPLYFNKLAQITNSNASASGIAPRNFHTQSFGTIETMPRTRMTAPRTSHSKGKMVSTTCFPATSTTNFICISANLRTLKFVQIRQTGRGKRGRVENSVHFLNFSLQTQLLQDKYALNDDLSLDTDTSCSKLATAESQTTHYF